MYITYLSKAKSCSNAPHIRKLKRKNNYKVMIHLQTKSFN